MNIYFRRTSAHAGRCRYGIAFRALVLMLMTLSTLLIGRAQAVEVGPVDLGGLSVDFYFKLNDTLHLIVDGEFGKELWKSDGTPSGTEFVMDYPGYSNPFVNFSCDGESPVSIRVTFREENLST